MANTEENAFENDSKEEKFIDIAEYTRKALYHYFMWPKKVTLKYKFGFTIHIICSFFITYGSIGHLIHSTAIHGFEFAFVADDIATIMTTSTLLYIIVGSLPIRKDLNYLIRVMGDFTYFRKPKSIVAINDRMDRIGKYVHYYVWFCLVGLIIIKGFEKCEPDDYSDCGLIMVSYLPLDIFSSPNRKIYMILQAMSATILGSIGHLNGWVCLIIVEVIICYVRELIIMVKEIPEIQDKKMRRKHFHKCIEYHQHILELSGFILFFTGKFLTAVSHLVSVHIFATPVIMSVIAFQLIAVEFDIKNIAHLNVWFVVTAAACVISERLRNESEHLFYAIFYSIPFDDDLKLSKDMMFMMLRSKSVISVSPVFGIGQLGHEHLMNIISTSYTYLSVLASTL